MWATHVWSFQRTYCDSQDVRQIRSPEVSYIFVFQCVVPILFVVWKVKEMVVGVALEIRSSVP